MAVVTGVLDVMCAMGVVGVALVTGMTDVAHAGNRDGLRRWRAHVAKALGASRSGGPVYAGRRTLPAGAARPRRATAVRLRSGQGVATSVPDIGEDG
ncbi:hypothetical protein [Streptomyces sp. NBRC 110611]|uniref:hypothetical protein n=1 Tax=Streptomyces sp. NBRC 110611 TaxID=1621259 RepID=UPI0011BF80A7|nr:hypothetical protein [Streptomyces sp. NBRC 110611]